jgi:hypothetical protein
MGEVRLPGELLAWEPAVAVAITVAVAAAVVVGLVRLLAVVCRMNNA